MPKILKEADNFSSFTWKDLPPEALLFIHEHYFSKEMTAEEYMAAYFGNKVSGIKHEADRLFEEAKQSTLEQGNFPDELLEVWTKKIIPKDAEEKSSSNFSKAHSKPIGEYYNIKAGEYEPTNKGIIHYDKNGGPILFLLSHNGRRKK